MSPLQIFFLVMQIPNFFFYQKILKKYFQKNLLLWKIWAIEEDNLQDQILKGICNC